MEHDANQLVDNTQPGNQPKAVELIELFYERIYGFLRRLTTNDADAADLTQRTFSKVWQKLPTLPDVLPPPRGSTVSLITFMWTGVAQTGAPRSALTPGGQLAPHRNPRPMKSPRAGTCRPWFMLAWTPCTPTSAIPFTYIIIKSSRCRKRRTPWMSLLAP